MSTRNAIKVDWAYRWANKWLTEQAETFNNELLPATKEVVSLASLLRKAYHRERKKLRRERYRANRSY